jgi:hypothetical protein
MGEYLARISHRSAPWDPTKTDKQRRGFIDDLKSKIDSKLDRVGDNVPSHIPSGLPNLFQDIPTGEKVQEILDLTDDQVAALPTEVLNMPFVVVDLPRLD